MTPTKTRMKPARPSKRAPRQASVRRAATTAGLPRGADVTAALPGQAKGHLDVLLASASAGAGHNQVAMALQASLAALDPAISCEWEDVLAFTPLWFRTQYVDIYSFIFTQLPGLYRAGFDFANLPRGPERAAWERARLLSERRALRRFAEYLRERRPSLIVHVHPVAAPLVGRMISSGRLDARQMVLVTDYYERVHRVWYSENVERWFLSSERGIPTLGSWGVPTDRITVTGMPVHPKWLAPLERRAAAERWGLPDGKRIVVLTGGTDFVYGPILGIARGLLRARDDVFLVALTGRERRVAERFARLGEPPDRLRVVPFTEGVHELVEAADLMITKAGGSATAECLAKGKPMVLLRPVYGQETANAAYLAGQGAATVVRDAAHAVEVTSHLLDNPEALRAMSARARRLHRPAAETIAAAIQLAVRDGTSRGD